MSKQEPYVCKVQYCPFSDRFPERKPAPISHVRFPLCRGDLPDEYHIQMFCDPYAEVYEKIPGFSIGVERLNFVVRNLSTKGFYHLKVGQITSILYLAIRCSSDNFDFATFMYEGSQFALLLDSVWYMVKRTEQNLADYISRTHRELPSEQLVELFEEFYRNFLQKCQDRWLKKVSNGSSIGEGNHESDQVEVPHVFNGGPDRLDDITRVTGIRKNLLSAIPEYHQSLIDGLNAIAVQ